MLGLTWRHWGIIMLAGLAGASLSTVAQQLILGTTYSWLTGGVIGLVTAGMIQWVLRWPKEE